jgi:hypothetical protein
LRGAVLKEEFKRRLLRYLCFLEEELQDYPKFKLLTRTDYITDRDKRRSVERWIENIINSSIDISKVILTLEGISLQFLLFLLIKLFFLKEKFGYLIVIER